MHGNRVVRAVEVRGRPDGGPAPRGSRQPEVRAVEEAINPYLEQDRDLTDPDSARVFFTRAALPAGPPRGAPAAGSPTTSTRHALFYPARTGCGMALARLLARQDEAAADDPTAPIASSTIFQRDDIVVRLIDVRGPLDAEPGLALGVQRPAQGGRARPVCSTTRRRTAVPTTSGRSRASSRTPT